MSIPGLSLEGERGHRRGVVMGLTMAEIMLLLLFCLLLASAGIINERETALAEAKADLVTAQRLTGRGVDVADVVALEREVAELRTESTRLREIVQTKQQQPASTPIAEETWRELELSAQVGQEVISAGITTTEVVEAVREIKSRAAAMPQAGPGTHDWPPIITLGNDEFRFPINSAEVGAAFRDRLNGEVADELRAILDTYDVDVIEVVGHTDESPISNTRVSTMDNKAIDALAGNIPIAELVPADNVGLGLARAIAVAKSLNFALADRDVKIIPLSAAQLVRPGDAVSSGTGGRIDPDRRRIEIRVRKSSEDQSP